MQLSIPVRDDAASSDESDNAAVAPLAERAPEGTLSVSVTVERMVAGLESGLPPEVWARRGPGLGHALARALLLTPAAFTALTLAATVVLSGTLVVTEIINASLGRPIAPSVLAFIGCVLFEVVAVAWFVRRRRRTALQERPLRLAQPLLTALARAPQASGARLELEPASRLNALLTRAQGTRLAMLDLELAPRSVELRLTMDAPESRLRQVRWPASERLVLGARDGRTRVELTLRDDAALAASLEALGHDLAQLLAALPDADAHASPPLRLSSASSASRLAAPPALARSAGTRTTLPAVRPAARQLARHWRVASLLSIAVCAQLFVAPLGALVAVAAASPTAMLERVLPAVIGIAAPLLIAALVLLARTPARRRHPQVPAASLEGSLELDPSGRWLTQHPHDGAASSAVDLHEAFDLVATREPGARAGAGSETVTLELRQRTPAGPQVVRFAVEVEAEEALFDSLPEWTSRAPRIDTSEVEGWLWPAIRFHALAHGLRVPWTLGRDEG